jgi:hypothetical protein
MASPNREHGILNQARRFIQDAGSYLTCCRGVSQDGKRIDNQSDPDFIAVACETTKASRSAIDQSPPRSAKISKKTTYNHSSIPICTLMQRYISGESLRKIAQEEHRDRATISKIVKCPEVVEYIEVLRGKFYGALEIAMDALLDELRNPNSKTRGGLAYEMLKSGGVIPNRSQTVGLELKTQEPEPESEQAAIKRIAVALVQGAIERHRYFGLPLEEADEIEATLHSQGKGENGHE